jgi:hypothetical protein
VGRRTLLIFFIIGVKKVCTGTKENKIVYSLENYKNIMSQAKEERCHHEGWKEIST